MLLWAKALRLSASSALISSRSCRVQNALAAAITATHSLVLLKPAQQRIGQAVVGLRPIEGQAHDAPGVGWRSHSSEVTST